MLTPRMKQIYDYLREREAAGQPCPTTQEIAEAIGLKARSGVSMIIQKMKDRGLVRHVTGFHKDFRVIERKAA